MQTSSTASATFALMKYRGLRPGLARRLMELVRHHRIDLTPLITHRFSLDNIGEAYRVFGERLDGVMKVAIKP